MLNYSAQDAWQGTNAFQLGLTQGIAGLGASKKGDLNLSRAQATPDFQKMTLSYTRQQGLLPDTVITGDLSGQLASVPLYSSEEFGVGGQRFGRAYDNS